MEFRAWGKTPRFFRDITVTEKIDGTNACVIIEKQTLCDPNIAIEDAPGGCKVVVTSGVGPPDFEGASVYYVGAQSRNRLIDPSGDNAGFAAWVWANAEALVASLGEGYHYGEWWGSGIQRAYGLTGGEKRFSLFNAHRYTPLLEALPIENVSVVPTLYIGQLNTSVINACLSDLLTSGSKAAPGFMRPEGVVVYHSASKQVYKVLLDNDDIPKSLVAA